MANVATLIDAFPNMIIYELAGDGTVAGPTITNAALLAAMVDGPLKDAWNSTYADQSKMRQALLGASSDGGNRIAGHCTVEVLLLATPVDTTAQRNQITVDVDTDAVTATKAEINIGMSDTTGQLAYLKIVHVHSYIR